MKQLFVIIILSFLSISADGQTSRALLVAIDKYPKASGWSEIHATNDIKLVEPLLIRQGFLQKNIKILTNEQATKAAVEGALRQLAFNSRLGDYIYIHFSCHGQQMADNNGDESDKLDEALIPYDAPRRYIEGVYEGVNHLRDDELGLILEAMRRKTGAKGEVVLTIDACHSGTGNRNNDDQTYIRGTTYVFAPPDFVQPKANTKSFVDKIASHPDMATLTVIAACMPDQQNYEYRCPTDSTYYGSLTYALYGACRVNRSMSFAALRIALERRMTEIRSRKGRTQTPLIQTSDEKRVFRIGL